MVKSNIAALWATCRSRSTAFLRMIKERGDFTVFNEAFCDLATVERYRYPLTGEVVDNDRALIGIIEREAGKSPVFFKETCEQSLLHLSTRRGFMRKTAHAFIIREPKATINSHYAMNPRVTREEIGFGHLLALFHFIRDELRHQPMVINSDDLVADPERVTRAYCDYVGVPFVASALQWRPGPIKEWQRTQKWHQAVSESSGIHRRETQYQATVDNNLLLRRYYNYHKPFYDELESYNFRKLRHRRR